MESSSRGKMSVPNQPFHNFRSSKPVDRRILCSRETSIGGYEGFKIVERSVAGVSKKKCLHYPVNLG